MSDKIKNYLRLGFLWLAGLLFTAYISEIFISYGHEQSWFDNTTGKVNAAMDFVSGAINSRYFIWVCFTVSGLTIGLWADYFLKSKEMRLIESNKDYIPKDHRDDIKLARRQAAYIISDNDLYYYFKKMMGDGYIKIAWKQEENGAYKYIGAGTKPPKGMTIKEVADKIGINLPMAEYMDTIISPDEVKGVIAVQYFVKNGLAEDGGGVVPPGEKLRWYFPTEQARLVNESIPKRRI